MKNRATLIVLSVILLLFFSSCDKKENRLVDYFVEIATIAKTESLITILLDNGTVLTPENTNKLDFKNGERVILNYTPLEKGFIYINSIRAIHISNIQETGYPHERETSPVKIISVWVIGNYLNMSFQVDYHSKPHTIGLYRNMQAEKPTLFFSYSRRDDPPGAPNLSYASFYLGSLNKQDFTIHINTYDGERKFEFNVK